MSRTQSDQRQRPRLLLERCCGFARLSQSGLEQRSLPLCLVFLVLTLAAPDELDQIRLVCALCQSPWRLARGKVLGVPQPLLRVSVCLCICVCVSLPSFSPSLPFSPLLLLPLPLLPSSPSACLARALLMLILWLLSPFPPICVHVLGCAATRLIPPRRAGPRTAAALTTTFSATSRAFTPTNT